MKLVVVAGLVLLGLRSAALASVPITTAPFPSGGLTEGTAVCAATNIGTATDTVTLQVFDLSGTMLTSTTVSANPGITVQTDPVPLLDWSPAYCSFSFNGKFKGSFDYVAPSGTPIVVIPATK